MIAKSVVVTLALLPALVAAQGHEPAREREVLDPGPVFVPGKGDREFPKVHDPSAFVRPAKPEPVRPVEEPPAPPLPLQGGGRPEGVFTDQPGDGNIWARGNTYKMRFGTDGVEYIPFLGSLAPRNFPLGLRVEVVSIGGMVLASDEAVAPSIDGTRVTYDRGAVLETWDLRPSEVEQRFVLSSAAAGGELVVRLAVSGELFYVGDEAGLLFEAPGYGAVRYGNALVFDACGSSLELPSRFVADGIEVRVPASFVAGAAFPVTIDPTVSTLAIDTTSLDNFNADVAYDVTNDMWNVCYEEVFSAADHDILSRRVAGAGALLEFLYQDSTTADARRPAVANNNGANQFLIVWDEGPGGSKNIRGRTRDAASTTQGATFSITTDAGDEINPDVGGDPAVGFVNYLVTWQDTFAAGDNDVYARRVSTTGTLGTITTIDASPLDETLPHVTKSAGGAGYWMLVYSKLFNPIVAPENDTYAAVVSFAGTLTMGATPVDGSTANDTDPDVAGDGTEFLVVFERDFGTDRDILGVRYTRSGTTFTNVSGTDNLTAGEPGAPLLDDQADPRACTDGCRFTYVYLEEEPGAGNYDVFAATVIGASSLTWHEGRVPMGATAVFEDEPSIASRFSAGGNEGRYMIVWDSATAAGNTDIRGALFNGTTPGGGLSTTPHGCGGASEPTISGSSPPALGSDFTVTLGGIVGAPVIHFGLPAALPLCPTQGGCVLGVLPIIVSFSTTSVTLTIPCDTILLGSTAAFQGFDVGAAATGGCGVPVWPFSFRGTDRLNVTIQ